jgi:hypothetical protein
VITPATRLSQARFVFGEIFRPIRSQRLPERGNAQARIALPQPRYDLLRLLHVSGKRNTSAPQHGFCRYGGRPDQLWHTGKVLKGAKPADLPIIQQSEKIELIELSEKNTGWHGMPH